MSSAAISERVPSEPTASEVRDNASVTTHIATLPSPNPPYSSGTVTPKTPSAPISAISSMGINESSRCHACACGATRSCAKRSNWRAINVSSSLSKGSPNSPNAISAARRARAEIGGPHDFPLAHRDSAGELSQVLAEPDGEDETLEIGHSALAVEPPG